MYNFKHIFLFFRYLAGSQYHISIRQLYECESKLRVNTILSLILKSKEYGDVPLTMEDILSITESDNEETCSNAIIPEPFLNICSSTNFSDIESIPENVWPPLVYISGYTAYAVSKKIKCDYCSTFLKEDIDNINNEYYNLITEVSRGGLCYPSEAVVQAVSYVYIILEKLLLEEQEFLKQKSQADLLRNLTFQVTFYELQIEFFPGHHCQNHDEEYLLQMLFKPATNILLKNYLKKHNDKTASKTMPHLKRLKPQKK